MDLESLKKEIIRKFKEYWEDFPLNVDLKITTDSKKMRIKGKVLGISLEKDFPLDSDPDKISEVFSLLLFLELLFSDKGKLGLPEDFLSKLYSLLKITGEIKDLGLE